MKFWHIVVAWLAALSIGAWMVVSGPLRVAPDGPSQGDVQVAPQPAPAYRKGPVSAAQSPPPVLRQPAGVSAPANAVPDESALGEWETFQRDARHTGYVPASFHPGRFREIWTWERPEDGSVLGGINAVATAPGLVAISDEEYHGNPAIRVLREADGALVWEQVFQNYPALNPPAVKNGAVYVTTTGHEQTFLWGFGVEDGTPIIQNSFYSQWPRLLAPTVEGGRVFVASGYMNDQVYAFDAVGGDLAWTSPTRWGVDMSTPAVHDGRVFQYDGSNLHAFDALSGAPIGVIPDPQSPGAAGTYNGAPVVGYADSVTALSGGAYNSFEARHLVNFSLARNRIRWRSSRTYATQPARAKGVIYAGSNTPKSFDAIDEATGQVLWSWVPGPEDVAFQHNVVVTANLVFVSTDRAVHALSLRTKRLVWSYPVPGKLAISGGGTLYIVETTERSTGRLIAISLNGRATGGRGLRRLR
ncbi:PQQ-binding-like beta-propeller repeat protein [Luteimonas sp. M1R5S18]|jgi:outer membrane protein assembly factor BamB|uniref:PQQ-binding-like beta-propeller repeat protein n=1 Tax=Luteimonas rhizosphaericola TaxID=3042024 RepID=A0ABT6JLI6_9GAMM|nr:PQQ-binding-like beta-propeller repeat protein [Luteimonas rhizosphaericola]MDH5831536.1 PQQ-binding-like beta-propeller repeat protein [Luteimonas rhizosphaericola]